MRTLTAATYNIHSSVGRDRRCRPDRVLAVLQEIGADIYGLQEVGYKGGGQIGGQQYEFLRRSLGLHGIAGPNVHCKHEHFGNVLLSRWPIVAHRLIDLSVPRCEARGAVEGDIAAPFGRLRAFVTHLGLRPHERLAQVRRLAEAIAEDPTTPTLVMGDFNIFGIERMFLHRIGGRGGWGASPASFPARFPMLALDRVWSVPGAMLSGLALHDSPTARRASDHLPVVGTFEYADEAVVAAQPAPRAAAG